VRRARSNGASGFTYIGLLIGIAIMGAVLASIGTVWHTQVQREREAELLFVGEQFQRAIGSYFERSPEAGKTYPKTLEDLLEDRRSGTVVRHLRKVFLDPMTNGAEWALVKQADGRIVGVHSLSDGRPLKISGFNEGAADFERAASYREWRFVYAPAARQSTGAPSPAVNPVSPGTPSAPPVPEEAAVGAIVNAPPEPRPNTKPRCDELRVDDQRRCVAAKPDATAAELGICLASAASRAYACEREQAPAELRLPK